MFHKYASMGPNGRILVLRDSQDLSGRKAISSRTGRLKPRNPKNRVLMKKAKMRTSIIFQPSQTPKKPKNLTATFNDGRVTIAYTAPDEGGDTITSYTWQKSTDSGSTWVTIRTNTTANPITITGLTNDTSHLFRTRAINSYGNGPWSDTVSGTPTVEEVEEEEVKEEVTEEVTEEEEGGGGGGSSYPSYKSWRIIYLSTAGLRIPYTRGIRFFDEKGALLQLNLGNVFRSADNKSLGANNNWAKHQPQNMSASNFSAARGPVSGNFWLGIHFGTKQMISKIHIGSTTKQYIAAYSWAGLLNKSTFPEFYIQGSNDADPSETGGLSTQMKGTWVSIMTVRESNLYEPHPITDTTPEATTKSNPSYIQGNKLTMRIIELPTV